MLTTCILHARADKAHTRACRTNIAVAVVQFPHQKRLVGRGVEQALSDEQIALTPDRQ